MSRYSLKKLPQNFCYFLSLKEIKEFEIKTTFRFDYISMGAITEAGHFKKEKRIQSSITLLSISTWRNDDVWKFSIRQSGYREELLPEHLNAEVKQEVMQKLMDYINKVKTSSITDGLIRPQLWVYMTIIEGKPKISYNELKK